MLDRWQTTIVDEKGNVRPGAVVQVRSETTGALAAVYKDPEGTQPWPTGFVTADENGYVYFHAHPDYYRITSINPAIDWRYVKIGVDTEQIAEAAAEAIEAATEQADRAEQEADRAEAARDAASLAALSVGAFSDSTLDDAISAGLDATSEGDSFSATGDDVDYIGLYRHDAGLVATEIARYPTAQAVSELKDSLVAVQQVIGPLEDPLTDGTAAAAQGTYAYRRPLRASGKGLIFHCYARQASSVWVQIVSASGSTKTVVREQQALVEEGVNRIVLPDLEYEAGQYVGFRCGGSTLGFINAADGNNGGYWSTGSTITEGGTYEGTAANAGHFKVRFEMLAQAVFGESVSYLERQVGEEDQEQVVFGRPVDAELTDGSDISTGTYIFVNRAERPIVLTGVAAYARTAGDIILRVYDDDETTLSNVSGDHRVTLSGTGEQTADNVPRVILNPGQHIGVNRGTARIAFVTGAGDSGGFFSGPGDGSNFTKGSINTTAQIQISLRFEPYTLTERVGYLEAVLEEGGGGGGGGGLSHDTDAFHIVWMIGESHVAGRATSFSSDIPDGRGYCYRRASTSLAHLEDPTGNDSTSISGSGRGSWGPPLGQALLDMTHGAVGAIIVNSGYGGATVGTHWSASGAAWTAAKNDWDNAIAAIKAAKLPVAGVTIVVDIGSNDASAGTDKATYKAGLLDMIQRAQDYVAAGGNTPVAIVMTGPYADGSNAEGVLDCQEAQAELAREEPGIYIASSAPKFATDKNWHQDNVHFKQIANDAIGPAVAAVALARGTGVYPDGLE